LVGGWVVGGIVDGAVNKIVKHVIWKLVQQQTQFTANSRRKGKKHQLFYSWLEVALWVP